MLCVPVFMAIYSMKLFIGPQAHAGEIMEMRNRSALSRDTPPTPGTGKSFYCFLVHSIFNYLRLHCRRVCTRSLYFVKILKIIFFFLKKRAAQGMSSSNRVAGWRLEDIDDNLAADFDGSLSGLGVDLSVASYNMRSVFLSQFVSNLIQVSNPSETMKLKNIYSIFRLNRSCKIEF